MPGAAPPGPPADPDPASGEDLATPWSRLAAAVVDGAVLQVAGLTVVRTTTAAATATAITAVAYLTYEVAMVAARGQTVGKLAMGTRVVDGVTGARPTLWQAATRAVVPLAGVVVDAALGSVGVAALWVLVVYGALLFDGRRRGLHDRAAGTEVAPAERSPVHRRLGAVALVGALVFTVYSLATTHGAGTAGSPGALTTVRRGRDPGARSAPLRPEGPGDRRRTT